MSQNDTFTLIIMVCLRKKQTTPINDQTNYAKDEKKQDKRKTLNVNEQKMFRAFHASHSLLLQVHLQNFDNLFR